MIISVNALRQFTDINLPIDELATLIGSRLVEIEQVIDYGKKFDGVVVAKVVSCQPHHDSDHLNICKLDDGGVAKEVERDEDGLVQVVCGAPNVREGLTVAWLPPGATVPETFGTDDPFVLGARSLRGVMSNGMIASAKELGLYDDHEGILEVDKDAQPGDSFAELYKLDDYLLDIENKSLTHRPDTFGLVGFAREVAGIQGQSFATPEWLARTDPEWLEKTGDLAAPTVTIDNAEISQRYQAVVLTDVDQTVQSPLWLKIFLSRIGVRPISAIVDVTNFLMMVAGQPLHAFDYDKLKAVGGGTIDIHVRSGRKGETLRLLDGREIELSENDIVIANGDTAVALAGAMGGADTEIDSNTKNVLLESATFNLYNLRNTQMRHGIFSEAITRFTKGQPAALTAPVLAEAVRMMNELTGVKRASDVADSYPGRAEPKPVFAMAEHMNAALGSEFTTDDIVTTLTNVEFNVTVKDDGLIRAVAPYWRADIHISEDLDEEVGRLNGFDTITPVLPRRDFTAVSPDSFDQLRAKIRQALVRAGANEVLTYSFVHGDLLQKAGQDISQSYRIINSLSPELQYYRQTLTPSLLQLVHPNIKAGFDSFALFELNKGHNKTMGLDKEDVPIETDYLALTVAAKKSDGGAGYFGAKRLLDYLGNTLGLTLVYTPIDKDPGYAESAPYDYRRSAMVSDATSDEYIGIIGEYKSAVKKAFKLPVYTAGFELDPRGLLRAAAKSGLHYQPLSRYPSTERDICFQVRQDVAYAAIVSSVNQALATTGLETSVQPIDIYQPETGDTKNVTLRIKLTSHDKTLSADDAADVITGVIDAVVASTNAIVI